jgi:hypothetical protein
LRRVEQTPGFVPMDWQHGTEVMDAPSVAASRLNAELLVKSGYNYRGNRGNR